MEEEEVIKPPLLLADSASLKLGNIQQKLSVKIEEALQLWSSIEEGNWEYFGLLAGSFLLAALLTRKRWLKKVAVAGFLALLVAQPSLVFYSRSEFAEKHQYISPLPINRYYAFLFGSLGGGFATFFLFRFCHRTEDFIKRKITSQSPFEIYGSEDIRDVFKKLSKISVVYKNEKYHRKDKVFVGLSLRRRPIYIPQEFWRSNHIQIVGTTGYGKGVLAGSLVYQSVLQGEAAVIFSPKDDEWAAHVMAKAAKDKGVPFYYIDLCGQTPQLNLCFNTPYLQLCELFSAALAHAERGTDADFYRLKDRAAARRFCKFSANKNLPFNKLVEHFLIDNPDLEEVAPKFKNDLLELSSLPVTHCRNGLNLKTELENGAVVYIQGSMRNEAVIKLQKALLLKVSQIAEDRDRETARQICIYLDEFKYLLGKQSLESLGAIRDKRAHAIIAHQSMGDLRVATSDIDPEEAVSSVKTNCGIFVSYRVGDPDTAEWISRKSGDKKVDEEVREYELTPALTEVDSNSRRLTKVRSPLIEINTLLSLPSRCAVISGVGLSKIVFTSPIRVTKEPNITIPTKFEEEISSASDTKSSNSLAEELINVNSKL